MDASSRNWLVFLIEKALRFLFLFSLFLLVLYLLGSFQNFLDRTEWILLRSLTANTLIGGVLAVYTLLYYIGAAVATRRFPLGRLVLSLVLLGFNTGVLVLIKFFTVWFRD